MSDAITLWLPDAVSLQSAGVSLAASLYELPLTILLSGELGAGKTTFLQGLAKGLGIDEPMTSPTYALEQHYLGRWMDPIHCTLQEIDILHADLYRLTARQADELVGTTDDHQGLRCIEWPERLSALPHGRCIHITLHDDPKSTGRTLIADFQDLPLPSEEQILAWREMVHLPSVIRTHCDTVASVCDRGAQLLAQHGRLLRPTAVHRAAMLHDLLRFIDFKPGAAHVEHQPNAEADLSWDTMRSRFAGMGHEEACAQFLRDEGYAALATIVSVHGLAFPFPETPVKRPTIEQQLLFYADKRVLLDRIVTLDERFADLQKRYGKPDDEADRSRWLAETRRVEDELFGGSPF